MIPVIVILLYLVVIASIGGAAYRRSKNNTEDFFLAGRTIGSAVFFLSLFATNMTAFAILGSSGAAYKQGIGIYGLMASSSGLVIPLTIFFIGTRLWALGKKFGHTTQVQYFRDRWECNRIGTAIFVLTSAMLIPYMIISIIGGGQVLNDISRTSPDAAPLIPYWLGCLIVTVVVTLNVFLGGMRGVVWVNVLQTTLFLLFGTIAVLIISGNVPGGLSNVMREIGADPVKSALITREKMPAELFWSYTFIPLSSIMFPHMSIMCLSARKMSAFKQTVVAYPIAIMLIWLPSVFLGVVGAQVIPGLKGTDSDGILLRMLTQYSPVWLAGLLGAGIISAVMGSDCHQVLALSTMFTKDMYEHYNGGKVQSERQKVFFARVFVLIFTAIAYVVALQKPTGIFELAQRFAFTGFAALAPVMIAALFWKRSTKWGALASTSWVAFCLLFSWYLTAVSDEIAPKPPVPGLKPKTSMIAVAPGSPLPPGGQGVSVVAAPGETVTARVPGTPGASPNAERPSPNVAPKKKPVTQVQIYPSLGNLFLRNATQVTVFGYLPVVPMVFGSALLMILVSLGTRPPSEATMRKYYG
ncbi:MAG: hypothetical protein H7308_14935 [Chthonomonadaceae bacterium]|nr:hypothetical protein [Chthonomonadaceae bacterium]